MTYTKINGKVYQVEGEVRNVALKIKALQDDLVRLNAEKAQAEADIAELQAI